MGEQALGRRSKNKMRLLGALTGAGLAGAASSGYLLVQHLGGAGNGAAGRAPATAEVVPQLVSATGMERKTGIRIVHVAVTGAGGLIDLRYQVVDPDKAASIHNAATPPVLVDEKTGVVVNRAFMGHTHTGVLHVGQTYYVIFENPGNLVQQGGQVTVALGGTRVPHVRVE